MISKTTDALRRADRALIGAFVLMLATAGVAAAYAPYTDEDASRGSVVEGAARAAVRESPHAGASERAFAVSEQSAAPSLQAVPSALEIAMIKFLAERRCLADAMYYEARGEGEAGQRAVAEVIFHRMHSRAYPSTICGVVYQGAGHAGCQFSFACDGNEHRTKTARAWAEAKLLAARIMMGADPLGDVTDDATAFHAVDVDPAWAGTMVRTVQIGNHIFYRPAPRTGEM